MARYTDADCRICRRHGEKLFLKGAKCIRNCTLEKRPNPPGQQQAGRRRKLSDAALQLREKQKARFAYGILERQFRSYYEEAASRPGVTGENLVRILESRLDNVVHRLGFADSRDQARQVVAHGHIALNGRKTDIPSARVKIGDVVGFSERGRKTEYYKILQEGMRNAPTPPPWLSLDPAAMAGRVLALPTRADGDKTFNENVIVEYYSR
ncbi:MAG: 30S ribosomal protein S4 [Dehalococcoidia bacterium]